METDIVDGEEENWKEKVDLWLKELYPNIDCNEFCGFDFVKELRFKLDVGIVFNRFDLKSFTKEQFKDFIEKTIIDAVSERKFNRPFVRLGNKTQFWY